MVKWIDDHLEELVMTVLLFFITAIITYAVIMRYVFNDSPSWAEEVTRFIFIWSAFLSISLCIKRQSSIRIDILLNVLSERGRTVLLMCVNIFVAVVLAYWLKGAVNVTRTLISNGQTSPALLIPMWTIYGASVVGFALGIIRSVQQVFINISALKNGR